MGLRQVINLANAPIIQDILSRLADLRDRFAKYEPAQALTLAYAREALLRANEALEAVGLPVPPDPGTQLRSLTLSTTEATTGQPYSATIGNLYAGTDYLTRTTTDREGLTVTGTTLAGTFASAVPDITLTEALYVKTAERGTAVVQAGSVTPAPRAFFSDPFFSDPFFRIGSLT